jgi:hypothetical protein
MWYRKGKGCAQRHVAGLSLYIHALNHYKDTSINHKSTHFPQGIMGISSPHASWTGSGPIQQGPLHKVELSILPIPQSSKQGIPPTSHNHSIYVHVCLPIYPAATFRSGYYGFSVTSEENGTWTAKQLTLSQLIMVDLA